jgi:hypothetical protein
VAGFVAVLHHRRRARTRRLAALAGAARLGRSLGPRAPLARGLRATRSLAEEFARRDAVTRDGLLDAPDDVLDLARPNFLGFLQLFDFRFDLRQGACHPLLRSDFACRCAHAHSGFQCPPEPSRLLLLRASNSLSHAL